MVKNFMFNNPYYQSSACQMQNYYKEPIYQMLQQVSYYVSLINKISKDSEFSLQTQFPAKRFFDKKLFSFFKKNDYPKLSVDPTRRIKNAFSVKIFTRNEIEMHHMSFVRLDLSQKIANSSGKELFKNIEDEIIKNHKKFNLESDKEKLKTIRIVDNIFNIEITDN